MQEQQEQRGSIPGSGRFPGGDSGSPLQYSCLGNPMDREAWKVTVHRVTKSQTQLNQLSKHTHIIYIGLRLILPNSFVMIQKHTFFLDKDSASFSFCWLIVTGPRPDTTPGWVWTLWAGSASLAVQGSRAVRAPPFLSGAGHVQEAFGLGWNSSGHAVSERVSSLSFSMVDQALDNHRGYLLLKHKQFLPHTCCCIWRISHSSKKICGVLGWLFHFVFIEE